MKKQAGKANRQPVKNRPATRKTPSAQSLPAKSKARAANSMSKPASSSLERRVRLLEDLERIKKLKAYYCTYCNGDLVKGPAHDHDKIASLFVEDAVADYIDIHPRLNGREEIRAFFKAARNTPFAMHRVTNPIIEVNGDTATGLWHLLMTTTTPDGQALWVAGIYDEDYVRTPEGWKFKSLRFQPVFMTPYDRGWAHTRFVSVTVGGGGDAMMEEAEVTEPDRDGP